MKKGLTKTKILEYCDLHNLETVVDIFRNSKDIFEYIKAIPDLQLEKLTFTEFSNYMQHGLAVGQMKAQMSSFGAGVRFS